MSDVQLVSGILASEGKISMTEQERQAMSNILRKLEFANNRVIALEDAITDAGLILSAMDHEDIGKYELKQKAMRRLGSVMNQDALNRQGI